MDTQEEKKEQEIKQETNETVDQHEECKKLVGVAEDKYKRALADYQNLVRRTQEQKIEWARSSNRELLLKVLPILDTLMLAQKHSSDEGFTISVTQFLKVLEEEGIKKIKTVGENFDPHTMEAVGTTEGEEGHVVEEVRAGFMMHDIVLRSAQVLVGKEKAEKIVN